ncbi:hypothetical protein HDU85_004275, partial [Gaertneriomyces sp. JEL0708]
MSGVRKSKRKEKEMAGVSRTPTLGRLKMQALLKREQEILRAKDLAPYPTPVEETSNHLLLKALRRHTSYIPASPSPILQHHQHPGFTYTPSASHSLHPYARYSYEMAPRSWLGGYAAAAGYPCEPFYDLSFEEPMDMSAYSYGQTQPPASGNVLERFHCQVGVQQQQQQQPQPQMQPQQGLGLGLELSPDVGGLRGMTVSTGPAVPDHAVGLSVDSGCVLSSLMGMEPSCEGFFGEKGGLEEALAPPPSVFRSPICPAETPAAVCSTSIPTTCQSGDDDAEMSLNYFYLYVDILRRTDCLCGATTEDDGCSCHGDDVNEMERFPLTHLPSAPTHILPLSALCPNRFPRLPPNVPTTLLRIPLQTSSLMRAQLACAQLNFKNLAVFEGRRGKMVECTTTVYHFGERILETKQILGPRECTESKSSPRHGQKDRGNRGMRTLTDRKDDAERHMYHFDFVPQFFEAFLAGFQCFEGDAERKIAIENLSIMQ